MRMVWKCKIPMKIKVFLWLVLHDRLQTGVNLKKKRLKGDHECKICGVPDTSDHIFFLCIIPRFIWTCVKETLGW